MRYSFKVNYHWRSCWASVVRWGVSWGYGVTNSSATSIDKWLLKGSYKKYQNDTLQGCQFTSTAMEITAIEWRRRWFIWIGFWRYIDRDL